ncbi:histidine kinase [Paenibacillus sp. CC-CFT747]|nr:histidine kinase [Paenibacillus sp. CC-CFT747]
MENSGIYYNEQLIRKVNAQLDEYFSGVRADSLALPGHPLIQEFIKADPLNPYEMYQLKVRLSNELVPNLRKDMYGFTVISSKGGYFGDFAALEMPLYEDNFKILGIGEKNGVPVILVYRKIIDNVTYAPAGALLMKMSLNQMLKIADIRPYGKNGNIVIANEEGMILYHTERDKWGTRLPEAWMDKMSKANGQFTLNDPEGRKMMVYGVSEQTSFRIVSEMSKSEQLAGLLHLQLLTLFIGAVILVLAFAVFYRMFREIRRLVSEIHATRMHEKELELRNREAVVVALQSRINPHFLYNTLEIINSYALLFNIKPISQMALHLSNIFRYSVSDPDQVVSLRKELDHTLSYIQIQKERFEDLEFVMEVDESMLDSVYLLRLTVQPLLENAFHHAYERHGLTPGRITIRGRAEQGVFSLSVCDEGRGMPPALLAQYNEAFRSWKEGDMGRPDKQPFRGIGLWNVHTRLRLAFGDPYGLSIARSGETGSDIRMMLPYLKGVVNHVQSADCG